MMDARRMVCGTDVRRYGIGPEDEARAEVMVTRLGGVVHLYATDAGCAAQWHCGDVTVTGSGPTYADALAHVAARVAQ
jgi:hypothetical protein